MTLIPSPEYTLTLPKDAEIQTICKTEFGWQIKYIVPEEECEEDSTDE